MIESALYMYTITLITVTGKIHTVFNVIFAIQHLQTVFASFDFAQTQLGLKRDNL